MIFLTFLLLVELLHFTYSAPKLGHVLFDPLRYEADIFVKKDVPSSTTLSEALRRFLGRMDKVDDITKKPCLGYDYDDKLCKLMKDRIICGYNKNLGQPKDSETVIDIGSGCFIRGNRIECGYITEPYPNLRRPRHNKDDDKNAKLIASEVFKTTKPRQIPTRLIQNSAAGKPQQTTILTTTNSSPTTTISSTTTPTTTFSTTTTTTLISSKPTVTTTTTKVTTEIPTKNSEQSTATSKSKLMCVDKNNSLFCYEIKDASYFIP